MFESPKARFARIVASSEEELNLAEAALLIATDEYPALEIEPYLAWLDAMAAEIRARVGSADSPVDIVRSMNEYLFEKQGFAGNMDRFDDPKNSFLNDVLDRKLGIPITLSVVYMEIGWRLGVPLEGVSFPSHFLVKFCYGRGEVVLDPFLKGVSLSLEELEARIRRLMGDHVPMDEYLPRFLVGVGKKDILARMLRNLKRIYIEGENYERALQVIDRALSIAPDNAEEVRDRGSLYNRLDCFRPALADFRRYLELSADAPDAEHIREQIIKLQDAVSKLN